MEHHVAGVVGAKVAIDSHDIGVIELGERLGFLDEAVETPAVVAGAILRSGHGLDAIGARCKVCGKILLDRNLPVEGYLAGEVGDAEAAGAQYTLDTIVADELRAGLQRDQIGHIGALTSRAFTTRTQCSATPRVQLMRPLTDSYDAGVWRSRERATKGEHYLWSVVVRPCCCRRRQGMFSRHLCGTGP